MPRGDKTGPNGMGSLTGRGLGYCRNNENIDIVKGCGGLGRGYGRGFNAGTVRGFGRSYSNIPPNPPVYSKEEELVMLKRQYEDLKESMDIIDNRIKNIETE